MRRSRGRNQIRTRLESGRRVKEGLARGQRRHERHPVLLRGNVVALLRLADEALRRARVGAIAAVARREPLHRRQFRGPAAPGGHMRTGAQARLHGGENVRKLGVARERIRHRQGGDDTIVLKLTHNFDGIWPPRRRHQRRDRAVNRHGLTRRHAAVQLGEGLARGQRDNDVGRLKRIRERARKVGRKIGRRDLWAGRRRRCVWRRAIVGSDQALCGVVVDLVALAEGLGQRLRLKAQARAEGAWRQGRRARRRQARRRRRRGRVAGGCARRVVGRRQ